MSILGKLKEMAEKFTEGLKPFDPSVFDDPVAEQTSWHPAKGGGTNIGTHALRKTSHQKVEFKAKLLGLLFPGVFMLIGLGVMVGMTAGGISQGQYELLYFGIPFGTIFFLVGFFIMRSWTTPRVFDKRSGYFWRGRQQPIRGMRQETNPDKRAHCKLEEIYAIQVLREHCSSSSSNGSSSYYSYEINLVLEDGSRINVVDHGKLRLIAQDSQALADFLDVPCWDAT
jgi:hypothetical protein